MGHGTLFVPLGGRLVSTPEVVDVLVVGAGPAGSTAALALATLAPQWRVVCVDKETFPRDKVCGDGLGPGVTRTLTALDATGVLDGALAIASVTLSAPSTRTASAAANDASNRARLGGHVLARRIFDARLVDAANARGVEQRFGWRARSSALVQGHRVVTFATPSGTRQVAARLVVAADGAYSRLRAATATARPDATHMAARTYRPVTLHGGAYLNDIRLDFVAGLLPGYGWLFPVSPTQANIGVGLPLTALSGGHAQLRRAFHDYVDFLATCGVTVGDDPTALRAHQLPHAGQKATLATDRMAFIGDAASMINPLSGEGIAYAREAALCLAQCATQGLDDAPGRFARRWRRQFFVHRASSVASFKFCCSRFGPAVLDAACADPRVVYDAGAMLFDHGRVRASTGWRLATALLRANRHPASNAAQTPA